MTPLYRRPPRAIYLVDQSTAHARPGRALLHLALWTAAVILCLLVLTGCGGPPVCLDRGVAGPLAVVAGVGGAYLALVLLWVLAGPAISRGLARLMGIRPW